MGLYDTNSNSRQLMEEFVRQTLAKYKKKLPNMTKSKSIEQKMSKHSVVYGGAIKLTGYDGDSRTKKHDTEKNIYK